MIKDGAYENNRTSKSLLMPGLLSATTAQFLTLSPKHPTTPSPPKPRDWTSPLLSQASLIRLKRDQVARHGKKRRISHFDARRVSRASRAASLFLDHARRLLVRKHLLLVHHPSDDDDGDGGDFGGADTDGRVALVLVAVVDIGLDVVVGRVVVGLLHAAGRLAALQDVVDFALDVLDHLAAVRFGAVASLDDVVAFVVAVLRRSRDALITLESGHRGDGEDGRERHGDQHLRQARHFFPCFGFGSPRKTEDWLRVDGSWQR